MQGFLFNKFRYLYRQKILIYYLIDILKIQKGEITYGEKI